VSSYGSNSTFGMPNVIFNGASDLLNGYEFQAVFVNKTGAPISPTGVTTAPGLLTVYFPPVISSSPASTMADAVYGTAYFGASATPGNPPATTQWQMSADGGQTWTDLGNFGNFSGTTINVLTISAAPISLDTNLFRALYSNTAGQASSSSAELKVYSNFTYRAYLYAYDAYIYAYYSYAVNPTDPLAQMAESYAAAAFVDAYDAYYFASIYITGWSEGYAYMAYNNSFYAELFSYYQYEYSGYSDYNAFNAYYCDSSTYIWSYYIYAGF